MPRPHWGPVVTRLTAREPSTPMGSDLLREAAEGLRGDSFGVAAFLCAVADWLDCQAETTCDCGVDESALTVARAYLDWAS